MMRTLLVALVVSLVVLLPFACGEDDGQKEKKADVTAPGPTPGPGATPGPAPAPTPAVVANGAHRELSLTWDKYTGGTPTSYRLLIAKTAAGTTEPLVSVDVKAPFDAVKPSFTVSSKANTVLARYLGGDACVTLIAIVSGKDSKATTPVCVDLR